jgi:hypothetical protein
VGAPPVIDDTDKPERYDNSWTMMVPTTDGDIHSYSGYLDLSLYRDNINAIIPEPATLSLLACGAVAILKRRRKRYTSN